MWKAVHVCQVGYIWEISVLPAHFVQTNTYRSYLFCDPKRCMVEDCRMNSPQGHLLLSIYRGSIT